MPQEGVEMGKGAVVELLFANGVWYRGRLVERVVGSKQARWRVQFDDGELRDDIRLGPRDREASVRFHASVYGATVEVRFDGQWRRGRLVELVRGGEQWGVAFENGDWAEDVQLGDPDVRYVFAGGGVGRGGKRGRGKDAGAGGSEESWKSVKTEGKGLGGSGRQKDGCHEGRGWPATACFECETCDKAFSQASNLAKHMRTHSGERPHVCETCFKAFLQASHLASHMRTHTGERPYVCERFGKAFSHSGSLALHMWTHTGEKLYVCETCGKACSTSSDLAVHLRTHSGEKPYVCETCDKAFSQASNLVKHMRTHSGERPHFCETCDKAFSTSGSLGKHMRTHTSAKP